jgi:hypothetical protein
MPILILSILLQLALIVHVLKTGRNPIWVFILLFAPVIGGLAYLIVEILPELTAGRTGRRLRSSVARAVNPDRDLKQAARDLAVAGTAQNAMKLAGEYLAKGRFAEARDLYAGALHGVHADDRDLLLGLARAQFELGEYREVIESLERLRQSHPGLKSPEGHLLYARAKEESGSKEEAIQEYEALAKYSSGPEARCRLAMLLKERGDAERARAIFRDVSSESKVAGRHYNSIHREWVQLAQREADS